MLRSKHLRKSGFQVMHAHMHLHLICLISLLPASSFTRARGNTEIEEIVDFNLKGI